MLEDLGPGAGTIGVAGWLGIASPPHSPFIPPLTAIDAARLKTYNAQYRDGFSVARIEQALRRIPLTPIPTRLDECR